MNPSNALKCIVAAYKIYRKAVRKMTDKYYYNGEKYSFVDAQPRVEFTPKVFYRSAQVIMFTRSIADKIYLHKKFIPPKKPVQAYN